MRSCPFKLSTRILGARVSTHNTSGHISIGDLSKLCLYFSHSAGILLHPVKRLSVSTTDSSAVLANMTATLGIFTTTHTHTSAKGLTWLATSKGLSDCVQNNFLVHQLGNLPFCRGIWMLSEDRCTVFSVFDQWLSVLWGIHFSGDTLMVFN